MSQFFALLLSGCRARAVVPCGHVCVLTLIDLGQENVVVGRCKDKPSCNRSTKLNRFNRYQSAHTTALALFRICCLESAFQTSKLGRMAQGCSGVRQWASLKRTSLSSTQLVYRTRPRFPRATSREACKACSQLGAAPILAREKQKGTGVHQTRSRQANQNRPKAVWPGAAPSQILDAA